MILKLFCRDYPEFEVELIFFQSSFSSDFADNTLQQCNYFLKMEPIGHTQHSWIIITYNCVPTSPIYVLQLTNYDSNFMSLPDIMANKEKIPKNNGLSLHRLEIKT